MKVYLLAGLGGDERLFSRLVFPPNFEPVFLPWVTPSLKDTMVSYAEKMLAQMDTTAPHCRIGVSFGGMLVATQQALMPAHTSILISSAATPHQLPTWYRFRPSWPLQNWIPPQLFTSASALKRLFAKESPATKALLKSMLAQADPRFIQWAIGAIRAWELPPSARGIDWHLHGNQDQLIPISRIRPSHIIPVGGHLMILEEYATINSILREILIVQACEQL